MKKQTETLGREYEAIVHKSDIIMYPKDKAQKMLDGIWAWINKHYISREEHHKEMAELERSIVGSMTGNTRGYQQNTNEK